MTVLWANILRFLRHQRSLPQATRIKDIWYNWQRLNWLWPLTALMPYYILENRVIFHKNSSRIWELWYRSHNVFLLGNYWKYIFILNYVSGIVANSLEVNLDFFLDYKQWLDMTSMQTITQKKNGTIPKVTIVNASNSLYPCRELILVCTHVVS